MGRFRIKKEWWPKEQGRSVKQRKNAEQIAALVLFLLAIILASILGNWAVDKLIGNIP